MKKKKESSGWDEEIKKPSNTRYLLKLFVIGTSPLSARAIENVWTICEEHLKGRYDLEVIDLYQKPELAGAEQIIAAPTLVKKFPLPLKRIIGDLSGKERVLTGLDLIPANLTL